MSILFTINFDSNPVPPRLPNTAPTPASQSVPRTAEPHAIPTTPNPTQTPSSQPVPAATDHKPCPPTPPRPTKSGPAQVPGADILPATRPSTRVISTFQEASQHTLSRRKKTV